jgi:hypothetical protein
MFHRIWEWARTHRTSAIWIAGLTLSIGACAHFALTLNAFWRVTESPNSPSAAIAAIERAEPVTFIALFGDTVCTIAGAILVLWASWRAYRRRP